MGKSFFDELGEALVKTTKDIGKKASQVYEGQRLQNKISGEELAVEKLKTEIGDRIYQQYLEGAVLGEEIFKLCEKIDHHLEMEDKYKNQAAGLRGCKLCPVCHKAVDKEAAFCSYCGSPCPDPKPEKEQEEVGMEAQPFCEGGEQEEKSEENCEPVEESEKQEPVEEKTETVTEE